MFVYRLTDIYSKLDELKEAGFEYVSLSEIRPDPGSDDFPCISFDGVTMENSEVAFDEVFAVNLPDGYYIDY